MVEANRIPGAPPTEIKGKTWQGQLPSEDSGKVVETLNTVLCSEMLVSVVTWCTALIKRPCCSN